MVETLTRAKQFIHLGFNNWISLDKVATIQVPNSAPAVRLVQTCRANNQLADLSNGRKTKAVIVLTTGQVVLSALAPDTIIGRMEGLNNKE